MRPDTPKVIIVGSGGLLGQALMRALRDEVDGRLVGWTRAELDVVDRHAVMEAIAGEAPDCVINAAAYTDVDGCETASREELAVNASAPGYLAEACTRCAARLVHISSDFVFDGEARCPYAPDDPMNPLSAYGRSKAAGESVIRDAACRHLIIRTSWLFGPGGGHFVDAILRKARAGEALRVVNDQRGCPTYTADLADAIVRLLATQAEGTFHFANGGSCTWYDLASAVLERTSPAGVSLTPISSEELSGPARRPAYSVLDTSRYTAVTGHTPAPWQDALDRYTRREEVSRAGST